MNKRHHVQSAFATSLLLLGAALLVGCRDKEAELAEAAKGAQADAVIERYKAAGLAQLERLRQVGEMMRDRAPLDADARSLPFSKASFKYDPNSPSDGAFIDARWLTEEGLRKNDFLVEQFAVNKFPFWKECGAYLTTGKGSSGLRPGYMPHTDATAVEKDMQGFLKVKYVGVARTVEIRYPEVTGEDEFEGGRYRLDMFFFELTEPPQYLGGLRVDARNKSDIEFVYGGTVSRREMAEDTLARDLKFQTRTALYKMMTERAKGVILGEPNDY